MPYKHLVLRVGLRFIRERGAELYRTFDDMRSCIGFSSSSLTDTKRRTPSCFCACSPTCWDCSSFVLCRAGIVYEKRASWHRVVLFDIIPVCLKEILHELSVPYPCKCPSDDMPHPDVVSLFHQQCPTPAMTPKYGEKIYSLPVEHSPPDILPAWTVNVIPSSTCVPPVFSCCDAESCFRPTVLCDVLLSLPTKWPTFVSLNPIIISVWFYLVRSSRCARVFQQYF